MKVEIWSDVVCPWCYIGKRHFEQALARFPHRDEVDLTWRSFELDPSAPTRRPQTMIELLRQKYGMSEDQARAANARVTEVAAGVGLEYHLDTARSGNTFDAHRLIHLAATHGLGDAMKERLLAAYFTEGEAIGDVETLERLAAEVGLDRSEVRAALQQKDAFAAEVRADEQRATSLGISGVPFFVVDGAFGVSGAQPPEVILGALERAWSEAHPLTMVSAPTGSAAGTDGSNGVGCDDGACAV